MSGTAKLPLHFWIVSGLSLVWNAFGAVDYVLTQFHNEAYLQQFTPEQRAHFDSFPAWMEAAWALGVWGAIAGSLLLLLRNKHAVTAFAVSLAGLAVSTVWQVAFSATRLSELFTTANWIMFAVIWIGAVALLYYAWRQGQAGRIH
jgi:hypothetical protein